MKKFIKLLANFFKKFTNKAFNKLSKWKKKKVVEELRKEVREKESPLSKIVKEVLRKDLNNVKLTKDEKNILNKYEEITDVQGDGWEWMDIKSKSRNFVEAGYHKKSKRCIVKMKRGKQYYTFYKVPRTKWLAVCDIGGRYMWDWFGQHYSTNPSHWIRRGPMARYSTANYTQPNRFKNKHRSR